MRAHADDDAPTAEQLRFFENRIRPVLVEHCYECHSEQAATTGKLRGQLKLDSRPASLRGGESGPAIVPGKLDESLIISALRYTDFEMPPSGKLPANVIKDFETWVAGGAADPRLTEQPTAKPMHTIDYEAGKKFWSFQPLTRPDLPKQPSINHPIDSFILARQAEAGLKISPIASARVLVRRAWFDLLGIPPTPSEFDHWVKRLGEPATQTSSSSINTEAWSELITQLLDRPEYGERWARHWMDVARFAESYGYEQDYDRSNAYHYRDFLIRAFNSNMPYDQFVQWQIAGDELAPQKPDAWMATGFLSAGAFPTQLTEDEFESARYDELDDMVSTTAQAFLGLSIGCARCHDHKFDPIASEEYYGLASVFSTAIRCETKLELDPAASQRILAEYQQKLASSKVKLAEYESSGLNDEFRKWLSGPAAREIPESPWQRLEGSISTSGGTEYKLLEDGSYLAQGKPPAKETLVFRSSEIKQSIRSLRLEALADKSLPRQGPGRADNGNFALGDVRVKWLPSGQPAVELKLTSARATHQQNQDSLSIAASIDSDPISGWAVDGQIGKSQAASFELVDTIPKDQTGQLEITLAFNHPNARHIIGRLRLSASQLQNPELKVGSDETPADVVQAINKLAVADLSKVDQDTELSASWNLGLKWFRSQSKTWQDLNSAVAELEKKGPPETKQSVQVTSEGLPILNHHANDRGFPHFYPETYVLRRGDVKQRVRPAEPTVPRVLHRQQESKLVSTASASNRPNEKSSYRRAALAQWLTDANNGAGSIVARVMVNRLWQHHFSSGIVATPNDFGATGDAPTHPELLEWMACELVDGGWRLKSLHHKIMTSQTYMQSGVTSRDARSEIDPANKLLWHRSPKRLEAEAIRDSMLSVSGLLDKAMYGPGSLDSMMKRRSIYFFIKRSQLIQPMILLDWPEHLVSIGRRQVTTIAPQSLQFMNAQWVRNCAVGLANRASAASLGDSQLKLSENLEAAVRQVYRIALNREASDRELAASLQFIQQNQRLKTGKTPDESTLAALTDYCQAILSLNEFIYVD